ncbi:MAG: ABC transporter ATP-binding protein/permease [Actinomycetota bacterium]|nr:ABC transporter ATP-binding protein/permease [Actinomycetota bacterium]
MRQSPFKDVSLSTLREAARVFRPAVTRQRRHLWAAITLTVALAVVKALQPWPLKFVLDTVVRRGSEGAFGLSSRGTIVAAALLTIGVAALHGLLNLRLAQRGAQVARDLTVGIRRQVFEHLHRLAIPFHGGQRTGELLTRLMGDVNMVRDTLFAMWLRMLEAVLLFIAMAVVMFVLDPVLALVALLPLPGIVIALPRSSRRLKEATRKQRRRQGQAAARAAESLRQIRLVKAYAAEGRATEKFARDSRAGERAGVQAARIAAEMDRVTNILTGLGLAVVLLVGARRAFVGAVTVGDLVVFLTYVRRLYQPLATVSEAGVKTGRATAGAERLLEVLREQPENSSAGRAAPAFSGDIAFEDVHFTYPRGAQALKGASFTVPAGAVAVLTGPNGAGKSTVVSLLLRLIDPTEGHVLIDGERVQEFQLTSYRRRFAYVPQQVQLFGATLRENILYGRPDATEAEVHEAARIALLDEVVARLPNGYNSMLGEGGETLSGGEARRLTIARAALRDARVLLLDEPLAGLDPAARELVARAIRQVAAGRTTIVVSHEAVEDFDADLVLRLEDGRLAEPVEPPLEDVASQR